jgi:hypothetical protein
MRVASHPDALEAALIAVWLARQTFASSLSERGSIFRDDDSGRWHGGFTDEERRELIRVDQKLQDEDAFATWQYERGS